MSTFADLAGTALKTLAPALGTAIAGPFGGLAAGWIAKKVLGKENATAAEIKDMVQNLSDPELALKIKQADREFEAQMKELGVDVFKLEVEDRASARKMAGQSQIMATLQAIIGTLVISGFLYGCWIVFIGDIDVTDANKALLIGTVFGSLSTAAFQVLGFLFGSTQSSQSKSIDMAAALQASVQRK